jgi:hypothetical protein
MLNRRWQDMVTLVAGVWFAVAPWALGHGDVANGVLSNSVLFGLAIALFSAGALVEPAIWEEVVDFLLGLWVIASPWALGYSALFDLTVSALTVGLIVIVLAAWTAMERAHLIEHKRRHGPV